MLTGARIGSYSRDKNAYTEIKESPSNCDVPTSESLGSNLTPVPEFFLADTRSVCWGGCYELGPGHRNAYSNNGQ